jgi:hypothetical protein
MELKVVKSTKQYEDYKIITGKGRIVVGTVNRSTFGGSGHTHYYTMLSDGMIDPSEKYKLTLTTSTLAEMRRRLKLFGADLDFCTEGCGKITENGICMACGVEIEARRAKARAVTPARQDFDEDYTILANYHSDTLSLAKGFTILSTESENKYMVYVKNVTYTKDTSSDNSLGLNVDDLEVMLAALKAKLAEDESLTAL